MRLEEGEYQCEATPGDWETIRLNYVKIGDGVTVHAFVNAYHCAIGADTSVGTFVEIQRGVRIGERCKIQSHTFICEGVTIEDEVFVGHGVMFTNDDFPRACKPDGSKQTDEDWQLLRTIVKRGASIGSGAVIRGGVTIGEGAMIGAGAVVTKSVDPRAVVVGNPARVLRRIDCT